MVRFASTKRVEDAEALRSVWRGNVVAQPIPEHCMSVLVVDTDTTQRESMKAVLGERYRLTFVAGMNEALAGAADDSA